jgi:hypothetical protein
MMTRSALLLAYCDPQFRHAGLVPAIHVLVFEASKEAVDIGT